MTMTSRSAPAHSAPLADTSQTAPRRVAARVLSLALLVLTLAAAPHGTNAQGLLDLFMSPEREKQVGAEEHAKIVAQFGGEYADPALTRYVDSIGQLLARTTGRRDLQFRFTVLDSPVVNAFALPGGYVYVTRGLLALASTEAEIAGVIGHEIGHVVARHGAQRQAGGTLAGIGLLVLGAVTGSQAAMQAGQLGAAALLSAYSRDDEYEADQLGIEFMARAGFEPRAAASFLRKLEAHADLEARLVGASAQQGGFDFFSSHPRTADRVGRALRTATARRVDDPIVAAEIYLAKIDGLIYGDSPEDGYVRDGRFVHAPLRLAFDAPRGYHLLNGADSVVGRGPGGAGLRFTGDRLPQPMSMTRYLTALWGRQLELREVRPLLVGDLPAATAYAHARTDDGAVFLRLAAVAFDERTVYRFLFVAPGNLPASLDDEFLRSVRSFRKLTAAEASRIQPAHLRLHTVRRGDTLDAVSALMDYPGPALDRLMVLNGLDRGAPIRPGQKLKIVR
ncbi:MAG: M48 family metalloprotease [Ectothiorhodospiraceae bacterium]|nr:M48 family metalloprotease [Ectothiorhodospiraceae bacterium]